MANSSAEPLRAASDAAAFRAAVPDDTAGIRQLLRQTPFGRRVVLTLEADPFHRHDLTDSDRSHTIVATRPTAPRTILGLAERSVHRVYLDGRPVRAGYLGQFRRKPGEEITLRRLREGFRLLEQHRLPDEAPFDFTSILSDNSPARRLLERGLPGLPRYVPAGPMHTLTFSASRATRLSAGEVRSLRPDDHEETLAILQRHHRRRQLAPCLDRTAFELPGTSWFVAVRKGHISGCVALWNQHSFKSVAIHDYGPGLRHLRIALNAARRLTGRPLLPPVGDRLPLAFLSFLATDRNHLPTIAALLHAAARDAHRRSLRFLNLGLPADHPALPSLRKSLRPEITTSLIYLVYPPLQENARLESALPVHPEIALL